MDNSPIYEFKTRVAESDNGGYYRTRWDMATPVIVYAVNADKAATKASESMGAPSRGRKWAVKIDSVSEVMKVNQNTEGE